MQRKLMDLPSVVIVAGALAVVSCSSSTPSRPPAGVTPSVQMEASQKECRAVDELTKDARVVARGRLGEVKAKEVDDGGNGSGVGIPMVFYDFEISESGKSPSDLPDKITLAWIDTGKVNVEDIASLSPGREYVFFLEELTADQVPGIDPKLTPIYVPLSGNSGVFDVSNGLARATSPDVRGLSSEEQLEAAPFELPADALINASMGK